MITPLDIENKQFSKSMRGFNIDEVDEFLDEIIIDLQKIMDENAKLKNEVQSLNQELTKYKKSETSMMNTLESAKKLMNDISESAERRAEIIIKNAQLDAEVIQRDAKESISKLTEEGERLRQKVARYREKYRQLLEDELNELDGSSEDLFAALEKDFLPASMTTPVAPAAAEALKAEKHPEVDVKVKARKQVHTAEHKTLARETIVVGDRSLEEILKEDFGAVDAKEDLTKTRIF